MKEYKIYATGWTHLEKTIMAKTEKDALDKAKKLSPLEFEEVEAGIENGDIEVVEE